MSKYGFFSGPYSLRIYEKVRTRKNSLDTFQVVFEMCSVSVHNEQYLKCLEVSLLIIHSIIEVNSHLFIVVFFIVAPFFENSGPTFTWSQVHHCVLDKNMNILKFYGYIQYLCVLLCF